MTIFGKTHNTQIKTQKRKSSFSYTLRILLDVTVYTRVVTLYLTISSPFAIGGDPNIFRERALPGKTGEKKKLHQRKLFFFAQ